METSNFRPEMHIAQQSRRERLRVQQQMNNQTQNVEEHYTNNILEQIPNNNEEGENNQDDVVLLQRLRYGNLAYNHQPVFTSETMNFTSHPQALVHQESSSSKINGDPQNFNTWKSICHGNNTTMNSFKTNISASASASYMNSINSFANNQRVRFSLADATSMPSRISGQKHYRDVQFDSHPVNENVTYDSGMGETCRVPWASERMVPSYAEKLITLHDLDNKEVEAREHTSIANSEGVHAQGLALSLSTMPLTKQNQRMMDEKIASLCSKPSNAMMFAKKSTTSGPLGPFTGYETILKTSKFLNPAQQLLHEICLCVAGPEKSNICSVKDLHEIRPFDGDDDVSPPIEPVDGNSGGPNEMIQEGASSRNDSFRPEFLQKKEKLVHMQEEVGIRYKHYYQQMQMVYSSFESVSGLTTATPYISVALKTISRLFHSIRNSISQHLKSVRKALGEDLSQSNGGNKCDTNSSSMFKLIDNPYRKQKVSVNNNLGFFEAQQNVWRPQRGLPERAVATLRAWLFDHFLHPYPTDSDKHMLASQTGLTRNQVSNWFINARVRIWKPMVEEIHSLESKATAETITNVGKNDIKTVTDASSCSNDSNRQLLNPIPANGFSGKQVEFGSNIGPSGFNGNPMNAQTWNHNGSVVDFVPYGMDLGGLGAVSLTLGLRQNVVGNNGQHSSQQQGGNQLLRRQCGGDQIVYDFVG